MNTKEMMSLLEDEPIIAAIRSFDGLENCLKSASRVVFILFGDILNISQIVTRVKDAGKTAILHIDLVEGLAPREVAIDYIIQNTKADGIISTKAALIKYAKQKELLTIQRFFYDRFHGF